MARNRCSRGQNGRGLEGRQGLFVLSLYTDRSDRLEGKLNRMVMWPQGEVSAVEAVAVVLHLARAQNEILVSMLKAVQEFEERGPLDQNCLAAVQAEGGKGSVFDAAA